MAYSLRDFLIQLREQGEIVEISKEVHPKFQAATLMKQMDDRNSPAILFTNIKDYSIPVVANLLATMRRIGIALNCKNPEVRDKITMAINTPIKPILVDHAPVKETIIKNKDSINLMRQRPILTHAELDAGP